MNNVRVFVSGGAGVIGRCLVQKLIEEKAELLVVDRLPKPEDWPKEASYMQADLCEINRSYVQEFQPEVYIHLAAVFERVQESWGFWENNFQNNVTLSHTLLKKMLNPALRRVVFASSYLVYDPALYLFPEPRKEAVALQESDALNPRNLCGMAKLLHERELHHLKLETGLESVFARIFRVYGKKSQDLILRTIRALLKGQRITLYQKENRFDWIAAEDVAEGLLRLAKSSFTGPVNLGLGQARSVEDLFGLLKNHFPKAQVKAIPSLDSYEASCADMTLFQKVTGWQPSWTLEEQLPLLISSEEKEMTAGSA